MKKLNKDNKGFSLVELLVVIAIMVVLVGVLAPSLLSNIEKSRVAKDIQNLDNIAGAIQDALMDENAYTNQPTTDAVYDFTSLYTAANVVADTDTPAAGQFKASFANKVKEYLPSGGSVTLSSKAVKSGNTIYFKITSTNNIEVWAATNSTAAPTTTSDGSTTFSVTR